MKLESVKNKFKQLNNWINNTVIGGVLAFLVIFSLLIAPRYYDGYILSKSYSIKKGETLTEISLSKGHALAYQFRCPIDDETYHAERDEGYKRSNFNKEYWVAYSNCNPVMNAIFFDVPIDISADSARKLITPKKVRKSHARNVVPVLFDRHKFCDHGHKAQLMNQDDIRPGELKRKAKNNLQKCRYISIRLVPRLLDVTK